MKKHQSFPVILDSMCIFKTGGNQEGTRDRFKSGVFYAILDNILADLACLITIVDASCDMFTCLKLFGALKNLQAKY